MFYSSSYFVWLKRLLRHPCHTIDMFVLITLKETVKIPPLKLHLSLNDCIRDELNDQLANKVIVNVGLCITLYDITNVGQSFLHQGDASSHTDGKCLHVMFHAFDCFVNEMNPFIASLDSDISLRRLPSLPI